MNEFLNQFGIDWKLFLSQLVNFVIILIVLKFFVYNPVLKILKDRNEKIKEGLDKAHEADVRLKEVDQIGKRKIAEAESRSMEIIIATEKRAKILEQELHRNIEDRQIQMQKELEQGHKKQQEESRAAVLDNAMDLIKMVITKTVELSPEDIDGALIKKAVKDIENDSR
jgi:F-type H+-transporting ATPase subunit b